MNPLEIPAVGMQMGQISSIIIIGVTGLALLLTLIFLGVSIFQQKKYDNDSLPVFEGLNPDAEETMIVIDDKPEGYAFDLADDDLDSEPIGNSAADEILKDMRAVELAPEKNKRFGLF